MIELVGIERNTFYEMQMAYDRFVAEMKAMLDRSADTDKRLGRWLDSQDVCELLRISPRTLQTFRNNGRLAYSQIDRKIYYRPEDVQAILKDVENYRKDAICRRRNK